MNFQTMSKQRKMILIAAAVGVIAMFLPWISISLGPFGGGSVSGMHGWGILVFLCFVVAGAVAFMGDQSSNLNQANWMVALLAGGIATLIIAIDFLKNMDFISLYGVGLYLALAAAICVLLFTFMFRSASDSLQGGFDSLKNSINSKINTPPTGTTTTTPSATNVSHTTTDETTRPTA